MLRLLCFILCAFIPQYLCGFVCQQTIDTYNSHVNVGNFTGAADLTFNSNVTYIIPGSQPDCPYCYIYVGKDQVVSLFVDGFLGHFTIINPLVNLRELMTNDQGPNGEPRLVDFNHESFKFNNPGGKYFSVSVIHDFLFDTDCMIKQMHLYHDPYVASMSYAGYTAPAVPIMPGLAQIPPSNEFVVTSTTNLYNWQVFLGEDVILPQEAWPVIELYYQSIAQKQISISNLFIPLSYGLPQNMASVLIPGDSLVIKYGGLWIGLNQIATYHSLYFNLTTESTPLESASTNVTNGGSVVVFWDLKGVTVNGGIYQVDAADYFQIIKDAYGIPKIARLVRFFDTWNTALAFTGGEKYPQFSSYVPGS